MDDREFIEELERRCEAGADVFFAMGEWGRLYALAGGRGPRFRDVKSPFGTSVSRPSDVREHLELARATVNQRITKRLTA